MVLATETKNMSMANGKEFSTGNHPVELFVPLLHLRNAGFEFEIVTPTGQPVALEMWAFPTEDAAVSGIFAELKPDFEQPRSLVDAAASLDQPMRYAAVFIPGGHGAMLGLPTDPNVGSLLRRANDHVRSRSASAMDRQLCWPHGWMATRSSTTATTWPSSHSVDKQTPRIGYMPGQMPWALSER